MELQTQTTWQQQTESDVYPNESCKQKTLVLHCIAIPYTLGIHFILLLHDSQQIPTN